MCMALSNCVLIWGIALSLRTSKSIRREQSIFLEGINRPTFLVSSSWSSDNSNPVPHAHLRPDSAQRSQFTPLHSLLALSLSYCRCCCNCCRYRAYPYFLPFAIFFAAAATAAGVVMAAGLGARPPPASAARCSGSGGGCKAAPMGVSGSSCAAALEEACAQVLRMRRHCCLVGE